MQVLVYSQLLPTIHFWLLAAATVSPCTAHESFETAELIVSPTNRFGPEAADLLSKYTIDGVAWRPANCSLSANDIKPRGTVTKVESIADFYTLGSEVMASSNPGMKILFASRIVDGEAVVVKVRSKTESFVDQAHEETWLKVTERLLNLPDSQHIAQLHEVLDDGDNYYLIGEKAEGMDLFEIVATKGKLNVEATKAVLSDLLHGLQDLHSAGYVHRDLKLENVVLDPLRVESARCPGDVMLTVMPFSQSAASRRFGLKIIDFDTAEVYDAGRLASEVVGSNQYIAPEAYHGKYSPASDIFALGSIAYTLVTGRHPFQSAIFDDAPGQSRVGSPQMQAIANRVLKYELHFDIAPLSQEPHLQHLLESLLAPAAEERPTIEEALAHPFFEGSIHKIQVF